MSALLQELTFVSLMFFMPNFHELSFAFQKQKKKAVSEELHLLLDLFFSCKKPAMPCTLYALSLRSLLAIGLIQGQLNLLIVEPFKEMFKVSLGRALNHLI